MRALCRQPGALLCAELSPCPQTHWVLITAWEVGAGIWRGPWLGLNKYSLKKWLTRNSELSADEETKAQLCCAAEADRSHKLLREAELGEARAGQ